MATSHARLLGILVAAAFLCSSASAGADPRKPHPHTGKLKKYDRVPPSKIGLKLGGVSTDDLRKGEPVLKKINLPGGFLRAVSIQDVHAPEKVVWEAINDLPNYPKMVEGVVACDVYSREKKMSGETTVCATYKLKAAGLPLTYYMKHIYEPKKHSMTFHLDYSRCSELSDSVGYWYVEDLKDGWCRVYYSTDSQMPAFVPGPVRNMITNLAAKRSTSWVDARCRELTGEGGGGGKSKGGLLKKAVLLAALAGAWQLYSTTGLLPGAA